MIRLITTKRLEALKCTAARLEETTAEKEDLAARVRRLKADGRRDQAIFLVRGETGMDHDEASAFVDAIETEERSGGGEERREPPAQDAGRG